MTKKYSIDQIKKMKDVTMNIEVTAEQKVNIDEGNYGIVDIGELAKAIEFCKGNMFPDSVAEFEDRFDLEIIQLSNEDDSHLFKDE